MIWLALGSSLAPLDWVVVCVFLIGIFAIGLSFHKKASTSIDSFFAGGRNLPWYLAGLSMVATTFAADTPLAVADLVGSSGISGNWLWWNFLLGGLLTTFFFARLWKRSGVLTELELIDLRYSGKKAKALRGFKSIYFGIIFNALIIGWVSNAMIELFQGFFGIEHSTAVLWTLACIAFVAIYSAVSGLLGIVFTDVIQFVIALVGCIILAVLVTKEVGGISSLKAALPEGSTRFFPEIGKDMSTGNMLSIGFAAFMARVSMQWWASWYPGAEPGGGGYIAQRMISTKSEKDSLFATLFFQIAHYTIRPWPWIVTGLCLIVLYPDLSGQTAFVASMNDFLPAGLKGLLLVAFFAAFMSTISTQLNWGASYLVNDFYRQFVNREASNKRLVAVSRITTILISVLAIVVAASFSSVKDVWDFVIEAGAGMGLVLILRWYWWRINAWSEWAATLGSIFFFAVAKLWFDLAFPHSFFFIVAETTALWLLVTFLTKPTSREKLQSFYKLVHPGGWWSGFKEGAKPGQNIGALVLCWIFALTMVYGFLFATGKAILAEWTAFWPMLGMTLGGAALFVYVLNRTKVFD